jgi:putative ATPase
VAAAHAVEHVGLPECRYALAQAAIYLSLAPKSNAALRGLSAATAHIREHGAAAPPAALRSAAYPGAAALGRGLGYDYPHDRAGHFSDQELLPEEVAGQRFFEPDEAEPLSQRRLEEIRRGRERAGGGSTGGARAEGGREEPERGGREDASRPASGPADGPEE